MTNTDTVFVTLCDNGYKDRALRTVRDLRGRGGWKGDIVVMCVGHSFDDAVLNEYTILQH